MLAFKNYVINEYKIENIASVSFKFSHSLTTSVDKKTNEVMNKHAINVAVKLFDKDLHLLHSDSLKFVKENDVVKILSYNGDVFAMEPPMFVELEITDTEPGFKGDTATGATKPAVVETGATVYVPLFVETGNKISIDTRTGEYLKRV